MSFRPQPELTPTSGMGSVAAGLHRDPQLESVLRHRAPELGLEIIRNRDLTQELTRSLDIGRERDRGMSR